MPCTQLSLSIRSSLPHRRIPCPESPVQSRLARVGGSPGRLPRPRSIVRNIGQDGGSLPISIQEGARPSVRLLGEGHRGPRGPGAGAPAPGHVHRRQRSEEHTSELQSLMRISYAVFCLKNKKTQKTIKDNDNTTQ